MRFGFLKVLGVLGAAALIAGCETNVEHFRNEGIALYGQHQYDKSLVSLNKALTYDEFDAKSNAYAGLIHYRAGEYVTAAYHFKLALQADPSLEEAKDGLIATYVKMGQPDLALDALERGTKVTDKIRDPRPEFLNVRGPYNKEIEQRMFLGQADDRLRIGNAYEKLGDLDNAMLYYQEALKKADQIADENIKGKIYLAMGNVSLKAGNKSAARNYMAQAYNANSNTPGLLEAMTRADLAVSDLVKP